MVRLQFVDIFKKLVKVIFSFYQTLYRIKKLIDEKKIMAQDYDEYNKKIKELEKAIETLGNTGLFGDYEDVGGMMHHDYDPTRPIK